MKTLTLLAAMCSLITVAVPPLEDLFAPPPLVLEPELPETPFDYEGIVLPDHYLVNDFPAAAGFQQAAIDLDNTPVDNPTTNEGATLGRVLFYDKKLSANATTSCASCHQQSHGFSDPNVFSIGFDGGLTGRHSMGISNARFYADGSFFWDERAETLEEQVLMPIQDPVEMGMTLTELETVVAAQSYYPELFEDAFGDSEVTSDRIARALAQFVRSIVNTNSKYDQARAEVNGPNMPFPAFTDEENLGKTLFFAPQELSNGNMGTCAGCHVSEAMVGPVLPGPAGSTNATINGIELVSVDQGVFNSTGNTNDIGKFKVPSLANIGARPPYMHDGRFATLEEVIAFYSGGVQAHANLGPPFVAPGPGGGEVGQFQFTEEEQAALVAFLHTLTDESLLTSEMYSDPFVSVCFGDLDNDGEITAGDLLAVLAEFGCVSGCTADISGDGEVGTSDLTDLLGVYGTSCLE